MSQDIHSHLEKLKTELSKLEPAVIHLQKADEAVKQLHTIIVKLVPLIGELQQENRKLTVSNTKLIEKIDKVDFPIRLDKIDSTVSSINHGLQNTQTRIGDLERNFKDDLQAKTNDIISKVDSTVFYLKQRIESFEKATVSHFEKQSKKNKFQNILLFISIGLIVGLIVFSVISSK